MMYFELWYNDHKWALRISDYMQLPFSNGPCGFMGVSFGSVHQDKIWPPKAKNGMVVHCSWIHLFLYIYFRDRFYDGFAILFITIRILPIELILESEGLKPPYQYTGWWFANMAFIFHFIYGMSSFPLTNSIIFQDGYCTTNQIW